MAAATTDLGSAPFWHASPVFGHGLGSFSQISSWEYPHNPCMEVLSEFGIVGAVLLFTPLLYLLAASAMRWRYVDQRTLGVFVLFFIAAQVSGDLFDSRMVFLLPILMATGALARHPPLGRLDQHLAQHRLGSSML